MRYEERTQLPRVLCAERNSLRVRASDSDLPCHRTDLQGQPGTQHCTPLRAGHTPKPILYTIAVATTTLFQNLRVSASCPTLEQPHVSNLRPRGPALPPSYRFPASSSSPTDGNSGPGDIFSGTQVCRTACWGYTLEQAHRRDLDESGVADSGAAIGARLADPRMLTT
jgi:hypothetical protein